MDDAFLVRGVDGADDLAGKMQRRRQREAAARHGRAAQPLVERLAFDQLHHQRDDAVLSLEPVNGGDVGMVQRGEQSRLALETRDALRVCDE